MTGFRSGNSATRERLPPTHPGDVLREDFLKPLGMTPYRLAQGIGIAEFEVEEILDGRRSITANTALRIARFTRTSPEFWMNLQAHYDLEIERNKLAGDLISIRPYERAA